MPQVFHIWLEVSALAVGYITRIQEQFVVANIPEN